MYKKCTAFHYTVVLISFFNNKFLDKSTCLAATCSPKLRRAQFCSLANSKRQVLLFQRISRTTRVRAMFFQLYMLSSFLCSFNAVVQYIANKYKLYSLCCHSFGHIQPPVLSNHVLLREVHLSENSISSLQLLSEQWLPVLQCLYVDNNRLVHSVINLQ